MTDLSGWSPWPTYSSLTLFVLSENEKCQTCLLFWIFCLEVLQGVSHDISERYKTFCSALNTHCSVMCRAPMTPQRDDYRKNINPHSQPPADVAPYMPQKEQFFGNFDHQPRQGRYAYWQYSVLCKESFMYSHLINDGAVILYTAIVVCIFVCWHTDF
jgi:hypothetical protein